MFALVFGFPAKRYHATPWGKNVNEADVAWPPEPWRLLRAFIATYYRKGNKSRWTENHLELMVNQLAEALPGYSLPEGTIHAHTRHYMPLGTLDKKGDEKTGLVFDAFVSLPEQGKLAVVWPEVTLDGELFDLASDLADAIGYLGRAESWIECEALAEWDGKINCQPTETEFSSTTKWLLAPRSLSNYQDVRNRLIEEAKKSIEINHGKPLSEKKLNTEIEKVFKTKGNKGGGVNTLPERLLDALNLETADYQKQKWNQPPAAREVLYYCEGKAIPGVIARIPKNGVVRRKPKSVYPTVARYILAGRPRPRLEDAVKIGEIMRRAAMSKFSFSKDENEKKIPNAPWEISGRDENREIIKDPSHPHAFWLSEDADSDGLIDHVSVFISGGIGDNIQARLDRITKIWLPRSGQEWRLALEGFAHPKDFPIEGIFGFSDEWQSITPFMASRYFQKSKDRNEQYQAEIIRLIKSRRLDSSLEFDADKVDVELLPKVNVGSAERRAIQFHRFRSKGGETQPDTSGALLRIIFPKKIQGPIALGYGSHFGLGLFSPAK